MTLRFNDNNIFTNEENTLGVIHIVRDPRNVLTSVNNHFHHKTFEEFYDNKKTIDWINKHSKEK